MARRLTPMPEIIASPANLPSDVRAVLAGYLTCEFATVNRGGEAIAWPAVPYVDPVDGHITCAVSIAFPVKAYNATAPSAGLAPVLGVPPAPAWRMHPPCSSRAGPPWPRCWTTRRT